MRKIGQSGGLLDRLLGPILKARLPLIVVKPLAKSVLVPLGLPPSVSATNAAIHKAMFRSGFTTLIISNEEMNDIIKIALEESGLLIKGISETIKNEAKEQKGGFLPLLLVTLTASVLGSVLTGRGVIRAGEGTIRLGKNL